MVTRYWRESRGLELAGHNPAHHESLVSGRAGDSTFDWFIGMTREGRERVLANLTRLHVDVELLGAGTLREDEPIS